MARTSGGKVFAYWPVMAVGAAFIVIPLAFRFAGAGLSSAWPAQGRPTRLELPTTVPLARGETTPPSSGRAVSYAPDADPFETVAPTSGSTMPKPSIDLGAAVEGPSHRVDAAPIVRPTESNGMLAVDYDLSRPYESGPSSGDGSPIDIRKKVVLNGRDAGSAELRVGTGSTISISRDALSRLLDQSGRQELARQVGQDTASYITFEQMRRQGIDVRYDPVSDQILVAG